MGLVVPVEKLVSNTCYAIGRELPSPPLEAHGKPLDGLGARRPVHNLTGGDCNVMMIFHVVVDLGLEEGIISLLPVQIRLFQA